MQLVKMLAPSVLAIGFLTAATQAQVADPGAGRAGVGRAGAVGRAGGAGRGRGVFTPPAPPPAPLFTPPGATIDQREANQQRRIAAGIVQGQLTPDEVAKLETQETNITTMEATFKSEGKLTPAEVQQLRQALNDASLQIWAERHDTEGNQMPVLRLGKDVFAQDQLTAKIESGDLTRAQARTFLEDFRRMVNLKRRLASENLTPELRTVLQAQYNDLLNQYFVVK